MPGKSAKKRRKSRTAEAAPESKHLSKSAYARRINVSPQYVGRLVKQGRIPVESDGRIDPVKADLHLRATRDKSRDPYRRSSLPTSKRDQEDAEAYRKARTLEQSLKTELLEIEVRQKRGELVDRAELTSAAFVAARTMRDAVLGVPRRISGALVGETNQRKIENILLAELTAALVSLTESELRRLFES